MPISIPFVATSDGYGDATTIAAQNGLSIAFTIANNSAVFQLGFKDPTGEIHWGEEIPSNPAEGGFTGVQGIRFRSYVPGKPAVIVATLYLETDPQPQGSTAYTSTLSPSGGQTPGVSSVQVNHNSGLVGVEPILDFDDNASGVGIVWSLADVPGSTKVTLSGTVPNAADKSSGSIQSFSSLIQATTFAGVENFLPVSGSPASCTPDLNYFYTLFELTSGSGFAVQPPTDYIANRPQLAIIGLWNETAGTVTTAWNGDWINVPTPNIPSGYIDIFLFFVYGHFANSIYLASSGVFIP